MQKVKPIAYELHHVDVDLHAPFRLLRRLPVRPAPVIAVTNTTHVVHRKDEAFLIRMPHHTRVLLAGDWT